MNPFIVKPGETIIGLGIDFTNRLATSETIAGVPTVTADAGLTVSGQAYQGAIALANIAVGAAQADAALNVFYTVTGTSGSVRKGTRLVWVRSASE
jgi:hypothetical protein